MGTRGGWRRGLRSGSGSLLRRRRLAGGFLLEVSGVLLRWSASALAAAGPDRLQVSQAARRGPASQGRAGVGFGRLRGLRRPRRGGPSERSLPHSGRTPGRAAPGPPGPLGCPAVRVSARARRGAGDGLRTPRRGPGGLRPQRLVSQPEKPLPGRGADAPKVTRGGGQGGRGHSERLRPAFCSPLTPPLLCVRVAAPPSRACQSARAAWQSLPGLVGLGAAGASPGGAHLGLSSVDPRLPVAGDCRVRRPAAGPAPRAPAPPPASPQRAGGRGAWGVIRVSVRLRVHRFPPFDPSGEKRGVSRRVRLREVLAFVFWSVPICVHSPALVRLQVLAA